MAGAGEYRAKQNHAGGKPPRPVEAAPRRARAGADDATKIQRQPLSAYRGVSQFTGLIGSGTHLRLRI